MAANPKREADDSSSDKVICPYCRTAWPRAEYPAHAKHMHPWQMYFLDNSQPRRPIEMRVKDEPTAKAKRSRKQAGGSMFVGSDDAVNYD